MISLIGYVLAVCIGISLGLLGGGGSVLALPVLVYVMGVPTKSAIAMTLIIVGSVALVGTIPHWRKGRVRLKTALIFGSATMIGAFTGARIASLPIVSETFQMLLFAALMLVAAVFMIWKTARAEQSTVPNLSSSAVHGSLNTAAALPAIYPKPVCRYCWLWLLTEGLAVGVLTGLVGVGGGFAIVPALVLLAKVPMRDAIATSLLIIFLNSVAGLLGYLGHVSINWPLTVSFTLAAGIGMVVGIYLSQRISAKQLQKSFGYFLLAVAALILVQNRHSFLRSQATSTLSPVSGQTLLWAQQKPIQSPSVEEEIVN
ncbi:MAG: sulfite exporter TauE/SafE family protein [Thainema sp.]